MEAGIPFQCVVGEPESIEKMIRDPSIATSIAQTQFKTEFLCVLISCTKATGLCDKKTRSLRNSFLQGPLEDVFTLIFKGKTRMVFSKITT